MSDGACVSGYLWQGAVIDALFKAYSIFSFCVFYALPFILFFVLYGERNTVYLNDQRAFSRMNRNLRNLLLA